MVARFRLSILIVLLATTVGYAWYSFAGRSGAAEPAPTGRVVVNVDPLHLAPDRRFLIALGDLGHLAGSGDSSAAGAPYEAAYEVDHWLVRCGPDRVATLPDPPDYASLNAMVVQEAARIMATTSAITSASRPTSTAEIDRELRSMHALRALNQIDERWTRGDHGAALAVRAADAMTLLVLETGDKVGASDSLAGRAIALTALATALDSSAATRIQCLLADELDYGADAYALAARLPEWDARRWFVARDDRRLAATADSRERRFLQVVRYARRSDLESWAPAAAAFERDPALALPLMSSGLSLRRFETTVGLGASLLACVAGDLAMFDGAGTTRNVASKDDDFGDLMNRFEDLMANMPAEADGPLIDRAVVRAYYRACFYSGIKAISDHMLYALHSLPDAEALSQSFASARQGPALEFAQWFKNLVDSRTGHRAVDRMRADVKGMKHFGEPMIRATLNEFLGTARAGTDPGVRVFSHLVAEHLDSRPWSRTTYTFLLRQAVMDLVRADSVDASMAATVHPHEIGWHAWWAGYQGDATTLLAIAGDASLTSAERAAALERAEHAGSPDSVAIMEAHQRFAEANPSDFRAVQRYASYCEDRGQLARGRQAIAAWLGRKDRSDQAFDEIFGRTLLARLLQKEGRLDEALAAVTPVVQSQQFGAMQRATLIFEELGRIAEAETLAVFAWQRYPDSETALALAVRMMWRAGDDALAARALASSPMLVSVETWRELLLPELIARERERSGAALDALGPLVGLNDVANMQLDRLAAELSRAGHDSLAFAVQSVVHLKYDDELSSRLRAYCYARNAYGRKMAKSWICRWASGRSPVDQTKLVWMTAQRGAPELLWDLPCPRPKSTDEEEGVWLMRAMAVTGGDSISAQHRNEVEAHFAKHTANRYRIFGRHLLGLEGQDAVLAAPATPRALSEAHYYLGLKAQRDGRLRDAAYWYARCIELNQRLNTEDYWAREQLIEWITDGHSMAWIQRDAARRRIPNPANLVF